ncbi:hypothetical protein [Psychrobacter sp. CAL346-MNA-CIBAN-0220]|uniref:hypothetical protein n=1 Tax=Psychrobacter sp. CAL346-MNA-CIBAN-0220 TaxID=3140457 RepID=UPI00332A008B
MNKTYYAVFTSTTIAASLLLSGCQLLTGYQKIDEPENATAWAGQIIPVTGEVNIACAGTYHCEITQIDKTSVISTDTHHPVDPTMLVSMSSADGIPYAKLNQREQTQMQVDMIPLVNNKSVKIVPLSASGMHGLTNYYVRVKPIKREIHINFYPENNIDYVERFAMIDEFKESGTYLLRAYRQKSPRDNGSLLEAASPEPLCIDLLKDNLLQRRFCKELDTANQGEFVEASMMNKPVPKAKAQS